MRGISAVLNLVLTANLSALGCAQPRVELARDQATQPSAPPDFTLAVYQIRTDLPDIGLLQRAVLHNGDRLRLSLHVNPALRLHLYVGILAASGKVSQLYPETTSAAAMVEPVAGELTLPRDGTYQVLGQPGEEVFGLVASRQAFDQAQQTAVLRGLLLPSLRDRDPPPTSGVRDRGEVVPGWLNAAGLGQLRFVLSHQ